MELIKQAIIKANVSLERLQTQSSDASSTMDRSGVARSAAPAWNPPRLQLDKANLDAHRVVSFSMTDPNHISFNLLRTRVHKALKANSWQRLAITSPQAGCGKTLVAVNLAFSLARYPNYKTVLIDLDLRKPGVSRTLGIQTVGSLGRCLEGVDDIKDCFAQVTDNLIVGLNNKAVKNSSEMMHGDRIDGLVAKVRDLFSPDLIIFDLPPTLVSDDVIAFLPHVDSALLVIAAGKTTPSEVADCDRQISAATNFLGVVLNKCEGELEEYQ